MCVRASEDNHFCVALEIIVMLMVDHHDHHNQHTRTGLKKKNILKETINKQ